MLRLCPTVFGSFLILSDGNVWVYIVGARKYIMGGIPGKSGEVPARGEMCAVARNHGLQGNCVGNVCCGWEPRPTVELCGKSVLWLGGHGLWGDCVGHVCCGWL